MLRLLTLSTALCACLAAQAASSSFHSATGEIHITEIGITGDPTRYRDVVLRLTGPSPVFEDPWSAGLRAIVDPEGRLRYGEDGRRSRR